MGEERDGPVTPKKKYTPEFKLRVVREALEVGIYKEVARRYQIDASMVGRWVRQYRQEGESAFDRTLRRQQTPAPTDVQQRLKELERENDWLKRIVGEKDLEIAILRDLLKRGAHVERTFRSGRTMDKPRVPGPASSTDSRWSSPFLSVKGPALMHWLTGPLAET